MKKEKLTFVYGHLAGFTIEMERQHFTRTETQEARLLIFGIRIRLAAMPEFKQQAVLAGH
jgi:hypothetical protein